MSDDAIDYYSKYLEANGYTMEGFKHSSRVANLIEFIRQYTPKGGRILDVGCGDMYLSTVLPEYQWVGIDINTDQSKSKAIKHNLEKTPYPFETSEFDTIICSEVLEHMFNPVAITEEIRRLIKPTGKYLLSTPNFGYIDHYLSQFNQLEADLEKPWTYEHIRQYTVLSHEQILRLCKFKITKITGADAHYSQFLCQGREPLRKRLQALGLKDPNFTVTDQIIGEMFPVHNHTIMVVAEPV